jgi:hypothetical protein
MPVDEHIERVCVIIGEIDSLRADINELESVLAIVTAARQSHLRPLRIAPGSLGQPLRALHSLAILHDPEDDQAASPPVMH